MKQLYRRSGLAYMLNSRCTGLSASFHNIRCHPACLPDDFEACTFLRHLRSLKGRHKEHPVSRVKDEIYQSPHSMSKRPSIQGPYNGQVNTYFVWFAIFIDTLKCFHTLDAYWSGRERPFCIVLCLRCHRMNIAFKIRRSRFLPLMSLREIYLSSAHC